MLILFEFIVGVAIGFEYFDDAKGWILSLGIIRIIILPELDE